MNEGSVTPFGAIRLRSLPGTLKRALDRLARHGRRAKEGHAPDPALGTLAASAIGEYAKAHRTLFERAERLVKKAERLRDSGTPSESANNRAERAREEVAAGLAALRASFATSAGAEGGHAFDEEVARRYPSLGLTDAHL